MIGFLRRLFGQKDAGDVPINLSGLVLLTGVPGAGKTLRMVQYIEAALAAGRPCYANGVNGLNLPGVIPFDDPHKWRDLPPNAVLFVDEAQRVFRARRGMVDPPKSITDMETIRHDGVCIVMTTQQATYLDKHIRGLVGHHEHLVEVLPGRMSNVYTFRSTREEITPASLKDARYQAWAHPRRLHGAYISAEVHTKKLRLSPGVMALGALAVFAVGLMIYAFAPKSKASQAEAPGAAVAAVKEDAPGKRQAKRPKTTMEYLMELQPRIPGAPWSAPVYDSVNQPGEPPKIACMIGSSCRCLTDQGTRYPMPQARCKAIVEAGGILNPFQTAREPEVGQGVQGQAPADTGAAAPAVAVVGIGDPGQVQAPYGQFRDGAPSPTLQTSF